MTWAERLAVPLLQHWAVFTLLPLPLLHRSCAPAFAAANGEFLLFQRAAYFAAGGHAAVRAAVLEDVGLARAMKALGFRVALADGEDRISCRMYADGASVQAGFVKNLFAFFGGSRRNLAAGLALAGVLWVLPLPLALLGLALGPGGDALAALGLVAYGLAVVGRLLLALRFGGHMGDAFLHPLAVAYVGGIAVQSARLAARGGATWKGRTLAPPPSRRR